MVGALGVGLPDQPGAGVRGARLVPTIRCAASGTSSSSVPHFAGAFVARDLGDEDGPDADRRFEFFVTYDRELVLEAARALMVKIAPASDLV